MNIDWKAAREICDGVQATIDAGLGKFTNPDQPDLVTVCAAHLELLRLAEAHLTHLAKYSPGSTKRPPTEEVLRRAIEESKHE